MKRLCFWLGVLCIIYAGLYFLGLLPVGFWHSTLDLFIGREPDAYYKIVLADTGGYEGVLALLVGVALILISKFSFKISPGDE